MCLSGDFDGSKIRSTSQDQLAMANGLSFGRRGLNQQSTETMQVVVQVADFQVPAAVSLASAAPASIKVSPGSSLKHDSSVFITSGSLFIPTKPLEAAERAKLSGTYFPRSPARRSRIKTVGCWVSTRIVH